MKVSLTHSCCRQILTAVCISWVSFVLASDVAFCQPTVSGTTESYIAKVGKSYVSEEEFQERFELTPAFGKRTRSQLDVEKLEFAYSMVAEKLLAQEAIERGIDKDTLVQAAVSNIRKLLARDELYRREVSQAVHISPGEVEAGMRQVQRELVLKYLFFENWQDADFVRKLMRTRNEFDHLRIDTSMSFLRDTVTLSWGDADVAIERAAYALKKGQISQVVVAGEGYYILTLESERSSPFYGSMQPAVFRERIEQKLRARKEKARMEGFVRQLMSKDNAYGRSTPLKALSEVLSDRAIKSGSDSMFTVTPEIANELRRHPWPVPMDSVVVVGDQVWSLDAVLDKFVATGFFFTEMNREAVFEKMNYQLKIWSQQELLAQEAMKRGLDEDPAVRKKLEMWREHINAEALKNRTQAEVKVTPAEVWSFMASQDGSLKVPEVQIRLLRTASLAVMEKALNQVSSGKSFAGVVQEWSADSAARRSGGLTDFFPMTKEPFGPLAWEMKVGERQGPLNRSDGVYMFELVGKRTPPTTNDTAFISAYKKAAGDYARLKKRGSMDAYLAQLGGKLGFTVFEDRLKQIKVSPIPMVTFRVLGFGGRMFEVPFVDKQTDWLGIDPTKAQTIQ
jgi:parvulin-like peptidyl-prolyl isomerase